MSRFEELREKTGKKYFALSAFDVHASTESHFYSGWDSCAAEYEKLIAEKDAAIENLRTHLLAECKSHRHTLDSNDDLRAELSIVNERTNKIAEQDGKDYTELKSKFEIAIKALQEIMSAEFVARGKTSLYLFINNKFDKIEQSGKTGELE